MSPPRQRTQGFPCAWTRLPGCGSCSSPTTVCCSPQRFLHAERAVLARRFRCSGRGAALRSGRLALDELGSVGAGKGTGRVSAGTGRVAAASHGTFRSGRSASLRCSERRSPGKPADGQDTRDTCGCYSGYSEDATADNVSSPRPRTCRGYSEDTQIRAGDYYGGYACGCYGDLTGSPLPAAASRSLRW